MLAAIRPDSINVALVLHVAGAMLLVGSLCVVAVALIGAWRQRDGAVAVTLTRFGLRAMLLAVVPSWLLMRLAAAWTSSREHLPSDYNPTWLGLGYAMADGGGILILLSVLAAIFGLRRLRRPADARSPIGRAIGVAALLLVAAYVVAVWAMTTKPA